MKVGQAGTLNLTGVSDDVGTDRDGTFGGKGRVSSSGQESSSDHCDDGTIRWECGVVRWTSGM